MTACASPTSKRSIVRFAPNNVTTTTIVHVLCSCVLVLNLTRTKYIRAFTKENQEQGYVGPQQGTRLGSQQMARVIGVSMF